MTEADRQFSNPTPPAQSNAVGIGVTLLATSTTAAAHDLNAYPALFGRFVEFRAMGGQVWLTFGPAPLPLVDKSKAAGATVAAGTSSANGYPVANTSVVYRLDRLQHRYLHVQADSGTPTLLITPCSQGKIQ